LIHFYKRKKVKTILFFGFPVETEDCLEPIEIKLFITI